MHERTRRRFAVAAFAISAFALIATSPASGTLSTFEGESVVGIDRSTPIDVQFRVSTVRQPVQRVEVRFGIPRHTPDRALAATTSVKLDGVPVAVNEFDHDLPAGSCQDGCVIDVHVDMMAVGPASPDATVRWSVGLFVNAGSPDAVTIVAVTQHPPAGPDRFIWYASGLGLGLLSALGWVLAGRRFRALRLGLAATSVLVTTWFVVYQGGAVLFVLHVGLDFATSAAVFVPIPLIVVAVGYGLRRHLQGYGLWLAVTGWVYLVVAVLVSVAMVAETTVYRPIELGLLGLAIVAPGVVAVTSPRLLAADRALAPGEVLVSTSQAVLIVANGLVLAALSPSVLTLSWGAGGSRWAEGILIFGGVVGACLLLVWGLQRWHRGKRRVLVATNGLLLLPLGFGAFLAIAAFEFLGPTGLVAAFLLAGAAIAGFFGGATVTPRGAAASGDRSGHDELAATTE